MGILIEINLAMMIHISIKMLYHECNVKIVEKQRLKIIYPLQLNILIRKLYKERIMKTADYFELQMWSWRCPYCGEWQDEKNDPAKVAVFHCQFCGKSSKPKKV